MSAVIRSTRAAGALRTGSGIAGTEIPLPVKQCTGTQERSAQWTAVIVLSARAAGVPRITTAGSEAATYRQIGRLRRTGGAGSAHQHLTARFLTVVPELSREAGVAAIISAGKPTVILKQSPAAALTARATGRSITTAI